MSLLKWDDALSTGIRSIDKQHMKLIDMLNEFYDNIKSKSTNEILSDLIKGMREYSVFHFDSEENLLKKYGYPRLDDHKSEHNRFIKKVEEFEERFNKGMIILSFEITDFLKSWIKGHIQVSDKEYSMFLKSKGVK